MLHILLEVSVDMPALTDSNSPPTIAMVTVVSGVITSDVHVTPATIQAVVDGSQSQSPHDAVEVLTPTGITSGSPG